MKKCVFGAVLAAAAFTLSCAPAFAAAGPGARGAPLDPRDLAGFNPSSLFGGHGVFLSATGSHDGASTIGGVPTEGSDPITIVHRPFRPGGFPTTQAIPEPGAWGLMLAGLTLIGLGLRRNRATARS